MKTSLIFLVCAIVICSQYGVLTKPSQVQIKNGEDAEDGEFPYMVQVRRGDNCFFCGGSIVASKWILTAGHCVEEEVEGQSGNYSIVYGTNLLYDCNSDDSEPDTVIKAKTLLRHPDYSLNFISGISSFDIGLIELEEEIPFNDYAQPIILTEEGDDSPIGEPGTLAGWGSAAVDEPPIANLQKLQLAVLPNEDCHDLIDHVWDGDLIYINETLSFCTNDQDNGLCSGDSGSPYTINGVQYGIASWSIKPCGSYPGVYSRIALPEHRQWIKKVTGV